MVSSKNLARKDIPCENLSRTIFPCKMLQVSFKESKEIALSCKLLDCKQCFPSEIIASISPQYIFSREDLGRFLTKDLSRIALPSNIVARNTLNGNSLKESIQGYASCEILAIISYLFRQKKNV